MDKHLQTCMILGPTGAKATMASGSVMVAFTLITVPLAQDGF